MTLMILMMILEVQKIGNVGIGDVASLDETGLAQGGLIVRTDHDPIIVQFFLLLIVISTVVVVVLVRLLWHGFLFVFLKSEIRIKFSDKSEKTANKNQKPNNQLIQLIRRWHCWMKQSIM